MSEQHQLWEAENRPVGALPKRSAASIVREPEGTKRPKHARDNEVDDSQMRELYSKSDIAKASG